MKKNIGIADKIIRIILALVMFILYISGMIPGIFGIILIVLSAIFVITSLVNFCPLYYPFGLSTTGKK